MRDRYHYVYRIDRPSTGEWYIGIRTCKCHPSQDRDYMGSGVRIRRIGREELVKRILVVVESRTEASRLESLLVGSEQIRDPRCLNLVHGGGVGVSGFRHTIESRLKMKRKFDKEHRQKLAEAARRTKNFSGKRHSAESVEKMRKSHSLVTEETRERLRTSLTGKKHSPETREKMRKSQQIRRLREVL